VLQTGPCGTALIQQDVPITNRKYLLHLQEVVGGFACGSQAVMRAAVVGDFSFLPDFLVRRPVHVAQHQYFAGAAVLNNDRHQPVAAGKIN
jgi:hypothetical protein